MPDPLAPKPQTFDTKAVSLCHLPRPGESLFEHMAEAGYEAMATLKDPERPEKHAWARQAPDIKDNWRSVARAMYATLALLAGAKPREVPARIEKAKSLNPKERPDGT